eukprot:EC720973.1.p1 GENE.EC720973.1~~EC720973.1.p1  ORF type:complete len:132 (+),score=3.85 EC720973.1:74-469(+)
MSSADEDEVNELIRRAQIGADLDRETRIPTIYSRQKRTESEKPSSATAVVPEVDEDVLRLERRLNELRADPPPRTSKDPSLLSLEERLAQLKSGSQPRPQRSLHDLDARFQQLAGRSALAENRMDERPLTE